MELKAVCPQCSKEIEFSPEELEGLDDLIEVECEAAAEEALDKAAEADTDNALEALGSGRAWRDLAFAIRNGNREEAEYQLDRIVSEGASDKLQHEVSLGRFGSRKAA